MATLSLKPNKPNMYSGERDSMRVRAWTYQVEKYLELIEISAVVGLKDATKTPYAASFFTKDPELQWYSIVKENVVPQGPAQLSYQHLSPRPRRYAVAPRTGVLTGPGHVSHRMYFICLVPLIGVWVCA